jgi:anti-sigma factor RsiW
MKPCAKNQKLIAWLLLGALDERQARDLRAHLETCETCRAYRTELAAVTDQLAAAKEGSEIQASESFHQRLVGRLGREESASLWESMAANLRTVSLNWRAALTVTGAVAAAVALLFLSVGGRGVSAPPQSAFKAGPVPREQGVHVDLAPTLANYQMVANQSLEQLDDLLTRQGNRNPPPVPVFRTPAFPGANAAD